MRKSLMLVCALALVVSPVLADNAAPQRLSDVANGPVAPVVVADLGGNSGGPIVSGGLTWFTDKGDFEAAAGDEICLEDWEKSNLPPNGIDGFNDPLCGGVACDPEGGCPYPEGSECEELCIQSNLGGGNPVEPNPRRANGMVAVTGPVFGIVGDIMLSNTFVDSHDLILNVEDVGAVGANTLDLLGGQT